MISVKEGNKQESKAVVPMRNRGNELMSSFNSCGGCNTCHQMTKIHFPANNVTWDRVGGGLQEQNFHKSCANSFFQRNLGNNQVQSIALGQKSPDQTVSQVAVPRIQRECACVGKEEDEIGKVQTKLTIGPVNDVYELEADRIAQQIIQMPESSLQTDQPHSRTNIQRVGINDIDRFEFSSNIRLNQVGGSPLSTLTRRFMEPRFGVDFSHIRLHTDQDAQKTASQIQAKAFTYGHHIWLGKDVNEQNRELIAHELTHVVQQKEDNHTISQAPPEIQRLPFGIRLPTGLRFLDSTEESMARSVYGNSLIYSRILLSNALGAGGRGFTMYVPSPVPGISGATVINIGPSAYNSPGSDRNLLIHELAHCWQSQHHPNPTQFMINSLESQAAVLVGGSAYCYVPGKNFGLYAAEQIAQQVENGESPIISHVSKASPGAPDLANILSLTLPRWEVQGSSGVRC